MKYKELIGKTIESIYRCKLREYDDTGYLMINFTDGTKVIIESGYSDWTGNSLYEYPTNIIVYKATDEKISKLEILRENPY